MGSADITSQARSGTSWMGSDDITSQARSGTSWQHLPHTHPANYYSTYFFIISLAVQHFVLKFLSGANKLSFFIYVKSTKNLGMCQNIYPQWQCQITDKYSAPLQCIAVLLTDGRNDNEFTFFPSRCLSVRVSSLEICTITINN